MAEHPIERAISEGERVAVGGSEGDVPNCRAGGVGARPLDLRRTEVDTNHLGRGDSNGNAESNRPGTASAVKDGDARSEVRQEEFAVRLERSHGHKVRHILTVSWGVRSGSHSPSPVSP